MEFLFIKIYLVKVVWGSIDETCWSAQECITELESSFLIKRFSVEEVQSAVFEKAPDKTPGPDGFPMLFYQKYWDLVKDDIMSLFLDFYNGSLDISKLNRATLCLIPKVPNANKITQFRPIGLLNCISKILTKVLANRLQCVLTKIVDISQSAF